MGSAADKTHGFRSAPSTICPGGGAPQVKARGSIVEMDHPRAGKMRVVGVPVRLSATPGSIRAPSPALASIPPTCWRRLLGLGSAEIEALRAAGAWVEAPFASARASANCSWRPRSPRPWRISMSLPGVFSRPCGIWMEEVHAPFHQHVERARQGVAGLDQGPELAALHQRLIARRVQSARLEALLARRMAFGAVLGKYRLHVLVVSSRPRARTRPGQTPATAASEYFVTALNPAFMTDLLVADLANLPQRKTYGNPPRRVTSASMPKARFMHASLPGAGSTAARR